MDAHSANEQESRPPIEYVYIERKAPRPEFAPKPKSKLNKFISKFQSSAVKQTEAIRQHGQEEAERTGVRKIQSQAAPGTGWAFL